MTEVKSHDFRRSGVIDRPRLAALEAVLEGFARRGALELSTMLRRPCQLTLCSLRQASWAELQDGLPETPNLALLAMPPLAGNALLAMTQRAVKVLVDLRLGGTGAPTDEGRPLTEVDQALAAAVLEGMLSELPRSLAKLLPLRAKLVSQELNRQFVQIAAPQDTCLVANLSACFGEAGTEELQLVLPVAGLRPLLEVLRPFGPPRAESDAAGVARVDPARVASAPVEVRVRLPAVSLPSGELASLEPGTVIALGHPKAAPLEVVVGDSVIAAASLGASGSHVAVRLVEIARSPKGPSPALQARGLQARAWAALEAHAEGSRAFPVSPTQANQSEPNSATGGPR
jgi:flagellar motor switch protein FliM